MRKPIYVHKIHIPEQQASFWKQMLGKFRARLQPQRTPGDEVKDHTDLVRRAFRSELSGILAAAVFAKKALDSTKQVDMPFPDALFAGEAPLDDAALTMLGAYVTALEAFRSDLIARNTPVTLAVAKGMTTWIVSVYTIIQPGKMAEGCEMWTKLATAADGVEEAHRFMLRRDPTDVERSYFTYLPELFLK